ncbi:hypothetical protein NDU88_001801, partial [Pleurodeles waltl]
MPYVVPQMAAAGNWESTSPTTEVCVAPSTSPLHHQGQRRHHTHRRMKIWNRSFSPIGVP